MCDSPHSVNNHEGSGHLANRAIFLRWHKGQKDRRPSRASIPKACLGRFLRINAMCGYGFVSQRDRSVTCQFGIRLIQDIGSKVSSTMINVYKYLNLTPIMLSLSVTKASALTTST